MYSWWCCNECKANLELSKLKVVNNIFIPPSPDDSSQAMGACYAQCINNKILNKNIKGIDSAYLGYQIDDFQSNDLIKKINVSKNKYKIITKNINLVAAKLLKNNLILCRASVKLNLGKIFR